MRLSHREVGVSGPRPTQIRSTAYHAGEERGATAIEAALVIGLFGALLFTFLEVAHYLSVRTVLLRSAQQALAIAVLSEEFQVQLSDVTSGSEELSDFTTIRNEILTKATEFPLAAIATGEGGDGYVRLYEFDPPDATISGGGSLDLGQSYAVVLRPGEEASVPTTGEVIKHPYVWQSDDTMEEILKTEPVIVHIYAQKRFFLPIFFETLPIRVAAVGWVQQYPKLGFDTEEFARSAAEGEDDEEPDSCPVQPGSGAGQCSSFDADDCECCDGGSAPRQLDCANGGVPRFSGSAGAGTCYCDCSAVTCPGGATPDGWICECPRCPFPGEVAAGCPESCWQADCGCAPTCVGG